MLALVNRAPTKTAYTLEVRIYSTHVHVGSMLHPLFQQAGQGGLLLYRNRKYVCFPLKALSDLKA